MVQKLFQMVYKEVRGLHQAAYILALFTFGSQLLALIRDRLLAHQFGAGIELDLYYTAFRIPDLLYVLFASTLSVYVLIPFISKRLEEDTTAFARKLLSQIFSLFLIAYVAIAVVAIISAPVLVEHLFPGFSEHREVLILLIRILLLQPLFLGVSSLLGVVTQIEHRFILYAISPLIYNVGIIGGLLFLYPIFGVVGLAYGVVLGAIGHVLIQVPFIIRSNLRPRFVLSFTMSDIIAVCRTSLTRAVTLSLHQVLLLGLVGFAGSMAIGSVSVFQFAFNLQSVPLAIIGVSYSVAAFPLLAQLYAERKFELFGKNIIIALRHIIFWALPAAALFIVIRAQFVRVVLGTGAFDWSDTRLTAAILALFMLSLVAQATYLLLVRALYAAGNTRLPLYVTLASSVSALIFSFFFYTVLTAHGAWYSFFESLMRLEHVQGIEVIALPLGYSCALIVYSFVLLLLGQKHFHMRVVTLIAPSLRSLAASSFGGYVAYTILNLYVAGIETDTVIALFLQGFLAGLGGLFGVIFVHHLCRSEELFEIYATLRRRFKKTDMVVPQNEDTLSV